MNAIAFVNTNGFVGSAVQTTRQKMKTKLQVAGAALGMIGGVGAGIFGGLLTVASWMSANESAQHWLSSASSTLSLLTISLIIFGACCLDWLEQNHA